MNDALDVTPTRRIDRFSSLTSTPLFVYGTLLFPEVINAIIGRAPQSHPATAHGWRAAALKNRVYPGLVSCSDHATDGRLLVDLSYHELRLLDDFEDAAYELRTIELAHGFSGLAYIWVDDKEICAENWDQQHFAGVHLPAYVARFTGRYAHKHTRT